MGVGAVIWAKTPSVSSAFFIRLVSIFNKRCTIKVFIFSVHYTRLVFIFSSDICPKMANKSSVLGAKTNMNNALN